MINDIIKNKIKRIILKVKIYIKRKLNGYWLQYDRDKDRWLKVRNGNGKNN